VKTRPLWSPVYNESVRLSKSDEQVWRLIGAGMRVRVPHGKPEEAMLVPDPRYPQHAPCAALPVSFASVQALLAAGLLHQMVEHRVGDSKSWRTGWREAGMDGDVADWYVAMQ
jgi:hypothetical protein